MGLVGRLNEQSIGTLSSQLALEQMWYSRLTFGVQLQLSFHSCNFTWNAYICREADNSQGEKEEVIKLIFGKGFLCAQKKITTENCCYDPLRSQCIFPLYVPIVTVLLWTRSFCPFCCPHGTARCLVHGSEACPFSRSTRTSL